MSKKFTKEQEDALNLDIHIALSANAGSGKTSVLVERYLRILERGLKEDYDLSPDNIVAITFTKKAAAEMLSRVIAKFSEKYEQRNYLNNNQQIDLQFVERIRSFRNKLTNARISTIHSFCLQIISNYPIEAGIPVNFREMSESERLQLLEEAFNRTLMIWLEDVSLKKLLANILSITNVNDLKQLSFKAISNIDLWEELSELYSKDFDDFIFHLGFIAKKTYRSCLGSLIANYEAFFEDRGILKVPFDKLEIIEEFLREGVRFTTDDYSYILFDSQFWELLSNFIEIIYTKELKPRVRTFEKDEDFILEFKIVSEQFRPLLKFLIKIIEYHKFLKELNESFGNVDLERRYFETSKTIFRFINDVFIEFGKLKYDEGLIDFSDMLIKTRELFRNYPEILNEVRKEIKFLLVDEFQDTDKIQFDIISLLVPLEGSKDGNIPNLFIVGDQKQSIYSFRNADVRVFKLAEEYILKLNQRNKTSGLLDLTTTFRLRPEIAGFVDLLLSDLMFYSSDDPYSEFQIEYEPFVIPSERLKISHLYNNSIVAPITFLLEVDGKEVNQEKKVIYKEELKISLEDDKPKTLSELLDTGDSFESEEKISTLPYLIARHIRFIVNNPNVQIYDRNLNEFRCVQFSDIAIISRKTKDLARIASVLGERSIPFIFFGSKNFFSTLEIQDVISFLKFLVNPKDDVALCAILRSIFFGFTDEMLANIAHIEEEKGLTFWDKLLLYRNFLLGGGANEFSPEECQVQIAKVEEAISVIEKLQPLVSLLPINELLHRILVETEWHRKVQVFQNSDQMMANMDELLDFARDYIATGFRTVLDFIDEIDYISRQGIQDVDRFGFVSADAVILLTIHSAKGLEFPVVYVHNIDYETRGAESIEVSKELGLIFPMEVAIGDEITKVDTLQSLFAHRQLELEQDAEENRILYVALTRASDYLILTGKLYERKKRAEGGSTISPKGRLETILNILDISFEKIESNDRKLLDAKIQVGQENENGDYEVVQKSILIPVDFIFDLYPQNLIDNAKNLVPSQEESENKILLLDKVESSFSKNILSSTKFNVYSYNPENYIKSYFLGVHRKLLEIMKTNLKEDYEHRDDIILSSFVGNTIHYCLEKINNWYDLDGFHLDKLIETLELSLYEQKRSIERAIQNQVIEQCLNIVQTKLFSKHKEKILSSRKEFEILFPFNENYLIAKIDLLFETENGNLEIWDWKSNNVSTREEMELVAKSYELQMKTYVYAVSQLKKGQKEYKAKLLFTKLARPNSEDTDWVYEFVWGGEELSQIEQEIYNYSKKINDLVL